MSRRMMSTRVALGAILLAVTLTLPACGGSPSGRTLAPCATQSSNTTVVNAESKFRSSFASAPFAGGAVVSDAVFSNLYLWPDPPNPPGVTSQTRIPNPQTWDQHLPSVSPSIAVPSEKRATLDRITCDLVHSAYFDALTQYGIAPPVFAGDETTLPDCVGPVLDNARANAGVIQSGALLDFVNCEESAPGPKTTQVNLFISPDLKVARRNSTADACTTTPGASGFHSNHLGSRNYAVLPTSTACNNSVASLTETLSHEMVEILSDPAQYGWIHETIAGRFFGDTSTEFNTGELGDICSSVGLHPTPPVPWNDAAARVGQLQVAPYWSNADNACVPSLMMNDILVNKTGNPIIRFTGQSNAHSVTLPIQAGRRANELVQALEIAITTGNDNLNGGSNRSDNATVTLSFTSGSSLGRAFAITNINLGNEWSNNSLHTAFLGVPPGLTVGDLSSLTLGTAFTGGDNWNVNGITLKAALSDPPASCPPTPLTLVDQRGFATLPDDSIGLKQLSQDQDNLFVAVPTGAGGAHAKQPISALLLTVRTGDDDLHGGSSLSDDAEALIQVRQDASPSGVPSTSRLIPYPNINTFGYWGNFTTTSIPLAVNALPPNTTVGDITGVIIHTTLSGDRWDVASVTLQASAGCA